MAVELLLTQKCQLILELVQTTADPTVVKSWIKKCTRAENVRVMGNRLVVFLEGLAKRKCDFRRAEKNS